MKQIIYIINIIAFICISCSTQKENDPSYYGPVENYDWNEVYESTPTNDSKLHLYLPKNITRATPAVIIMPGGCYIEHVTEYEGLNWIPFFIKLGFATAVLEYNLPNGNPYVTIDHVKRAFEHLRTTTNYNIDPDNIGIVGFSAGGHLASIVSTLFVSDIKPAFQVLFYPVISFEDNYANTPIHKQCRDLFIGSKASMETKRLYSSNLQVKINSPSTFIAVGTKDQTISPTNSYIYQASLEANGVECKLVTAPGGDHGYINWVNLTPIRQLLREWLSSKFPIQEIDEANNLQSSL